MLLHLLHNRVTKILYHPFPTKIYIISENTRIQKERTLFMIQYIDIFFNAVNLCTNSDLIKKDNHVLPIKLLSRCFWVARLKLSCRSCPPHLLSLWKSSPSKSMRLHRPNLAKLFSLICSNTTNVRKSYRLYFQNISAFTTSAASTTETLAQVTIILPFWVSLPLYSLHLTQQSEGAFKTKICPIPPTFKTLSTHWLPISLWAKIKFFRWSTKLSDLPVPPCFLLLTPIYSHHCSHAGLFIPRSACCWTHSRLLASTLPNLSLLQKLFP